MSTLFIHIASSQKCGRTLRLLTPGRGCRFLTTTQTSAPGTGSRPGPFPVTLRSWPLRFGLRLYPPISPAADHARERGGSGVRVGARSASSQMMDEAMAAWFLARGVSPRCETPFRSCLTSLGIVCSSVPSDLASKKKKGFISRLPHVPQLNDDAPGCESDSCFCVLTLEHGVTCTRNDCDSQKTRARRRVRF